MKGISKKTPKKYIHDFKGFVKDEDVAKISQAMAEQRQTTLTCVWIRMTLSSS